MSKHEKKTKKRILKEFRIDEISLVDNPMVESARVAILKRANENLEKVLPSPRSGEERADFVSRFMSNDKAKKEFPDRDQRLAVAQRKLTKRMALTTSSNGHSHTIIGVQASSDSLAEKKAGQTSFVDDHSHDWIMDESGNIAIADANDHSHSVGFMVEKLAETKLLPEEGVLADLLRKGLDPAGGQAADTDGTEESSMTPEEKAAIEKKAADEKAELQKRVDRAEQVVSLSPEQRGHFDALRAEEQDEFLSKSSDEREAIVKNAQAADPVIYKSLDGVEYRKSTDSTILSLVKSNDNLRKQAEESAEITKRASFEKRAGEELGHLKGETVAKADLLEAVATLPEDKQAPVMEILKSKDAGMAKAMTRIGNKGSDPDSDGHDAILKIAQRLQESDSKLTKDQAYVKALETPEGLALFTKLRPEHV